MSYEMTGKIKQIHQTVTFPSGFSKREFVVTTHDQYPQDVAFEVIKEKTALLDSLSAGQEVTVHFEIRGREYNGRHFVNLTAWKIDTATSERITSVPAAIPEMKEEESFPWDDDPTPF